jgi:hypothetical protein
MTRYRVVCVELDRTKDIDEWVQYIGIEDDEEYVRFSQNKVIEHIQNGDIFYIRASDCQSEEEYDIELEIKVEQGNYYLAAPPKRGYISGNPLLDIGSCKPYFFEPSPF